jgi:TRAP-type mannitol/chloroaromatic compound transport system permease small subunit
MRGGWIWLERIDRINELVGRAVAWLMLALVALVFAVVVARYGFGWGRVWLQESYLWVHATAFMLAAGYTLRHDGHVRIDVLYAQRSARYRALVDLVGSLVLLLPMAGLLLWTSLPYAAESWARGEASREAGGLPALYLLKSVIPTAFALLILQGLLLAARAARTLLAQPAADR